MLIGFLDLQSVLLREIVLFHGVNTCTDFHKILVYEILYEYLGVCTLFMLATYYYASFVAM